MKIIKIKQSRFDSLAAYARNPRAKLSGQEVAWYETEDRSIVSCIIKDHTDKDFFGLLMARDESERYRFINCTDWTETFDICEHHLFKKILEVHDNIEQERLQGGINHNPIDFFSPLKKTQNKLSISFNDLTKNEVYSSAKNIIEPMMRWYEDADGNFIEQFQTTGFNQRIWELYLFALLTENDITFNQKEAIPDFICDSFYGEFCIEATTINPTIVDGKEEKLPKCNSIEELNNIIKNYYPIKFGSALYSKLNKKYWEKPSCIGKPLIFAITDCLEPASGKDSRESLPCYLYGVEQEAREDNLGNISIFPVRISEHSWQGKKIPSGFFNIPDAKYISAVIFSNDASLGKFNRMGLVNNFSPEGSEMIREGLAFDDDTSWPKPFRLKVESRYYSEKWSEGLEIYHNPHALYPLDKEAFPYAAHSYQSADGTIDTFMPKFHPIASITKVKII